MKKEEDGNKKHMGQTENKQKDDRLNHINNHIKRKQYKHTIKQKKSIPAETVKNCQCWDFPSGPVADSEFPRQGSWAQPLIRDLRCHMLQLRSHRPIKEPTCLN